MKTAIYIRVSTQFQETDRQYEEMVNYANEVLREEISLEDIYKDVISGFKDGEARPEYGRLQSNVEKGKYKQVLISEFSRLDRKPSNLLKSIEFFQQHKTNLYFKKQNIWVREKEDLGTQMMVHILSVMSQYEIELLTSRSIDGKITAIKNKNINAGGFTPYGYFSEPVSKKMIIDETEANVVREIFQMYIDGKSSLEIVDYLNINGVPTAYATRIRQSQNKRKNRGGVEKEYERFDVENLKWRASTINRMLKNDIYIGKRNFTFYEPDPSNVNPIHKREDRKILSQFDTSVEELRIIDDDTFYQVQKQLNENMFNKNLGVRHPNLLKHLLRCGECGSRFSVGKATDGRKYRCYGVVNRVDKPRICDTGAEIRMDKLDGLVVQLSIGLFANADLETSSMKKENEQLKIINENETLISQLEKDLLVRTEQHKTKIKRLLKIDKDELFEQLMEEENREFNEYRNIVIEKSVKYKQQIVKAKGVIKSLQKMRSNKSYKVRGYEIKQDKDLLKSYINDFIDTIDIYRITKLWFLVIVKYKDDGEAWGTIKAARYKNSELFYDGELFLSEGVEYTGWFLPNWDLSLKYDKDNHIVKYNDSTNLLSGVKGGEYTYEEFNDILNNSGWIGSFPSFYY